MAKPEDLAWLVDEVASLLEISKSQARQYVIEGAVYVNGFVVDDLAAKIEIHRATLSVISLQEARRKKGTAP